MKILSNTKLTNIVNNKNVRNIASKVCNPKALLPVILLEVAVTTGRSYQAYKRGGKTECRERLIDESITAVVWFGIITWLNQGLGKLIKQKGIFDKKGLPEIDTDLGADAIRNPIKNAIKKRPDIKNKICSLKFMKIITAALAGIYLSGIVVPKFYQSLTEKILKKEKAQKRQVMFEKTQNNNKNEIKSQKIKQERISLKEYINKTSAKNNNMNFGSAANFIHLLESNSIAKLLTVDVGLFAGRAYSSRNADERTEYLFRDLASSFFYMFSTPLIFLGLSKYIDKYKGKNTAVDANTAHYITEYLSKNANNISVNDFEKIVIGQNKELAMKIVRNIKGETISIADFENLAKFYIKDNKQLNEVLTQANNFIKLRPESASKTLLTLSEVINSVQGGKINNAEFLTKAVEIASPNGISQKSTKFIPYKEIDKMKQDIAKYAESILEYAKKHNVSTITNDILTQVKNRNMLAKLGYTSIGLIISGAFLSTIIPKIQYKITEIRTGNKEFPGIRDIK